MHGLVVGIAVLAALALLVSRVEAFTMGTTRAFTSRRHTLEMKGKVRCVSVPSDVIAAKIRLPVPFSHDVHLQRVAHTHNRAARYQSTSGEST
jgi:hypothetical protein